MAKANRRASRDAQTASVRALARVLAHERARRGVTQQAVAIRARLTVASYTRIAPSDPKWSVVVRITGALGISTSRLAALEAKGGDA
ncbi:MAG TPA: helix-turn-helix transcriptional regulator [Solirubrobacteraceae bacterium]|nr:helix-turn-helix transcriptional regulator [Solirubrobacteraceae bacterium]